MESDPLVRSARGLAIVAVLIPVLLTLWGVFLR
jgi:hypothetical protein